MAHLRLRKFNTKDWYATQKLDNDMCMVVRAGRHIFLRGQTGWTLDRKFVGAGDPAAQADQAMKNVKILLEEAEIGGEIITALALDREHAFREKLQAAGVTFVDDVDRAAFAEKTKAVYGQIKQWTPGLYDTVQAAMSK